MAYSEKLADRIRTVLQDRDDVVEKKMFGGLAFMVAGSMACGIVGDDLMARVGRDRYEAALARPHARIMDFTGRPLRGFILVGAAGVRTGPSLKRWVDETVALAVSLPKEKTPKATRKKTTPKKKKKTARGAAR